jgi:hypothetical protein
MNDAILPPNQQEGSQSQMRSCKFVVRGGERYAQEDAEPSSKRHKGTGRMCGKEQSGWSELSTSLAKNSSAQNKNCSGLHEK